jgi:glutamine cyclotransferase
MRIVTAFLRGVTALAIALLCAGLGPPARAASPAPVLPWHVVAAYPHDVDAYTEGLTFDSQGRLLESIGRYARSALIVREPASGKALHRVDLDNREFAEGIAVVGQRIVQLTWLNQLGHVYDTNLKLLSSFPLDAEGWGLTYDGRRLIQSDGTAQLHFLDPKTFATTGSVEVRDGAAPVSQLNELEYAKGLVYANLWHDDRVAIIAPTTGQVVGWLDLHALRAQLNPPPGWHSDDDVLNGIAFDPRSGHFFLTGKCWPRLFEIAVDKPVQ